MDSNGRSFRRKILLNQIVQETKALSASLELACQFKKKKSVPKDVYRGESKKFEPVLSKQSETILEKLDLNAMKDPSSILRSSYQCPRDYNSPNGLDFTLSKVSNPERSKKRNLSKKSAQKHMNDKFCKYKTSTPNNGYKSVDFGTQKVQLQKKHKVEAAQLNPIDRTATKKKVSLSHDFTSNIYDHRPCESTIAKSRQNPDSSNRDFRRRIKEEKELTAGHIMEKPGRNASINSENAKILREKAKNFFCSINYNLVN